MSLLDVLRSLSSSKVPSEMSDSQLQRKLNSGVGKNTGESIATRAAYIKEGQKRGIYAQQDKKK